MAKLSSSSRNKMSASTFGLPKQRAYPMPDKAHARVAKARAAEEVKKGNLTKAQQAKIDAKADKVLGKSGSNAKAAKASPAKGKGARKK